MHTLKKPQYQVFLFLTKISNFPATLCDEARWYCFYFSCVMLILELPVRRRWRNSRQLIVSSLNFKEPYKGPCYIKVPFVFLIIWLFLFSLFLIDFVKTKKLETKSNLLFHLAHLHFFTNNLLFLRSWAHSS